MSKNFQERKKITEQELYNFISNLRSSGKVKDYLKEGLLDLRNLLIDHNRYPDLSNLYLTDNRFKEFISL